MTIPDTWKDRDVYVSFQGVDDYYELYVNGHKAGSGGDIETRQTAFESAHQPQGDATRATRPEGGDRCCASTTGTDLVACSAPWC